VINLATGTATSVKDIADEILRIAQRPATPKVSVGERPGQVLLHIGDPARAASLLGWRAKTSLADGLAKTYRWYEAHPEWWEPSPLDAPGPHPPPRRPRGTALGSG
jgi:nucleoside-diphosphate-sugar epimerase